MILHNFSTNVHFAFFDHTERQIWLITLTENLATAAVYTALTST